MRERVAIVTPWYGEFATGGAETLARELASRLARDHDVTVLTTCAKSFSAPWDENYFVAGEAPGFDYTVRRFPVVAHAKREFDELNGRLLSLPRDRWRELRWDDSDTALFIDESINSPRLEAYLAGEAEALYDAVLFLPYLYGVVVRGIEAYSGKAYLIACLHDEVYARIPRIERMMHRAAGILANSDGEAELALRLYGPGLLHKLHVIGSGIEEPAESLDGSSGVDLAISEPYALYLGRRDVTKNVDFLVAAYRRFRATSDEPLSLVLAGPGETSYDDRAQGIFDVGFVDDATKAALIARTTALVQPSANESYSRVVMEAWFHRKPVAVNASCLATAQAVRAADGGYLGESTEEWVHIFRAIASGAPSELAAFGSRGESYAREKADWVRVIERLRVVCGFTTAAGDVGRGRRIDQFVQTLDYGDAISEYAVLVRSRLHQLGFASTIFAEGIGSRVSDQASYVEPHSFDASDAIIYHHSIASAATRRVAALPQRKALIYHNITPAHFARPYSLAFATLLHVGRSETAELIPAFDVYVGDSDFNAAELVEVGASGVHTVPVVTDFRRFDQCPARATLVESRDWVEVLFVGRVAPNKGIAQLITVFAAFRALEPRAHLTIVGRFDPSDLFYQALRRSVLARRLEASITFAGMVDEATLHACYLRADVYVCLSEHEGFCVPLVEAMMFDLPIIALAATAVPETMGTAGLLVREGSDPVEVAALVNAVCSDPALRSAIVTSQRERRRAFFPEVAARRLDAVIAELVS